MTEHLTPEQLERLAFAAYAEHEPAFAHQENHTRLWHTLMEQFREVARAQTPVVAELIEQARADEREGILSTLKAQAERMRCAGGGIYTRDYILGFQACRRLAREAPAEQDGAVR